MLFTVTNIWGFTIPKIYLSGTKVCEINKTMTENEFFKWVTVPINYHSIFSAKTQIYTYTKKPFNKNLPTVIYFTGGPGVSSRSTEFDLPNTNVLFFEQRGVSCSRPIKEKTFLDPDFYSSENTAKDALAILKAYQIEKAAIYGQSYGTIPATIFASKFPKHTKVLIIEGVVYHADKTLWNSKIKQQLLQNFFDSLSPITQKQILDWSSNDIVPKNWFSKIGNMMLYMDDGINIYKNFLDNLLSMSNEDFKNFVLNFYPTPKDAEEFSFGDVMMGMIGCKEMSMNQPHLSMTMEFKNNKLEYDDHNFDFFERCLPLSLTQINYSPYQADQYPVKVPVFYLLGENDGATDLNQGLNHFKNIPQNEKHLLILSNGGHLPSLGLLKDNRQCIPEETTDHCESLKKNSIMTKIFEKIIHLQKIDDKDLSEFNLNSDVKWKHQI
jgi:proline iminopeptidase